MAIVIFGTVVRAGGTQLARNQEAYPHSADGVAGRVSVPITGEAAATQHLPDPPAEQVPVLLGESYYPANLSGRTRGGCYVAGETVAFDADEAAALIAAGVATAA